MTSAVRPSKMPWVLWAVTLAVAAAAAFIGHQRFADEVDAKDRALTAADEAEQRAQTAAKQAQSAGDQLQQARDAARDLESRTSELSMTLEEKEAQIKALTATYSALEDKLKAEIKKGDVRLSQSGGRIQVDLVDKILFDSGKAEVTPRGEEVLVRLGGVLAGIDDKQIQVSGHTDDSPITNAELQAKFASNWELSVARAVNVVHVLADKASVKPARLSAAGYSQYHPIAANATPKGRALNRRIEVLLLPALEAKAITAK